MAKVLLGLARGKKLWDKRAAVAKRDVEREIARARAPVVRGAHPERDVERAIERSGALRRGERVLVACSGGPDSVALAAALHARREAAAARAVRSVRQSRLARIGVAGRMRRAAARRAIRDSARRRSRSTAAAATSSACAPRGTARCAAAARRATCRVVATAHHAEDQSETVVLALLRGTGPDGLRGMPRAAVARAEHRPRAPAARRPVGDTARILSRASLAVRGRSDERRD